MGDVLSKLKQYLKENYRDEDFLYLDRPISLKKSPTKKAKAHVKPPPVIKKEKVETPPPPPAKPEPKKELPTKKPTLKKETPYVAKRTIARSKGAAADSLKGIYAKVAPHLFVHEAPPDDAVAKRRKSAWKEAEELPPISVFIGEMEKKEILFLQSVAHAIETAIGKCHAISIHEWEKRDLWGAILSSDGLKCILLTEKTLNSSPNLKKHYNEEEKRLGGTPLFLLGEIETYFKNSQAKSDLWKGICCDIRKVCNRSL